MMSKYFDAKITLGNILQGVLILFAIVAWALTMASNVSVLDAKINAVEKLVIDQRKEMIENVKTLRKSQDELTTAINSLSIEVAKLSKVR